MAYALTKEFVEKLVNQPITGFEVSAGAGQADNVAGELAAIKVQTAQGDTIHLVHKTFPLDPMGKAFMADGGGFRTENLFYSQFAPELESLVKTRAPSNYKLPIPKFYAGFNNDNDDYITMEDVRPSGYKMADKFKGLNFAETSLLLRELGRYHALTYFLIKHEGEKYFEKYPALKDLKWMRPEKMPEMMLMAEGATKYTVDIVTQENPEYGARLSAKLAGLNPVEAFGKPMDETDKLFFPIILHGDMWMNNALFKYDAQGNPVEVKFIDFQMVRRGNLFEELKYFFFTSTTPEFRRNHLYQALDIYYSAFIDTLAEIKCPAPIGFSRGFLIDNFDNYRFAGYIHMGFALPFQMGNNPKMDAGAGEGAPEMPPGFNPMDIPMEIRTAGFVGHLRKQLETSPKAVQRLMDITQEMADLKLI